MTSFYNQYIETVTKNDARTRSSVDAIMGRVDSLLADNEKNGEPSRVSGLVVGRVQSGKTRNYVGLALKAADAGWNVIIVLTSAIKALAEQTEGRMMRDFKKSGVKKKFAYRLNFLKNEDKEGSSFEEEEDFFYYGVAMKQRESLARIAKWIEDNKSQASHMRVLVIDDEADNATPNSNAGKDASLSDPEGVVQDMATAMRECKADDFNGLADWLESLMDFVEPDEAANTKATKAYKKLRQLLGDNKSAKVKAKAILHDNLDIRELLGLALTAAESVGSEAWTDNTDEPLYLVAEHFFSGKAYEKPRRAADFINTLKAVFQIVKDRSTINKAIISLVDKPSADASSFTYPFEKCAYIAYTATPYACILNERPDHTPIYADFIASLDKAPQYFGLDEIYGSDLKNAKSRMDIIRAIPDDEKCMILEPIQGLCGKGEKEREVCVKKDLSCVYEKHKKIVWQSLKDAIAWTFCCAAARRWHRLTIDVPKMESEITDHDELNAKLKATELRWTTMLFNIHQKTAVHKQTKDFVEKYFECRLGSTKATAEFVGECKALWENETARFDKAKFNVLFNSNGGTGAGDYGKVNATPAWDEIEPYLSHFLKPANRHVLVINSMDKKNQEFYIQAEGATPLDEDQLWIVCGGNTIARGLTLDGLVASYFDRIRKTVAVDTMTQMARWFGYRIGYELLPRVWMTPDSVADMKSTAVLEDRMHASIKENFDNGFSPSDQSHYQMVYCYGRRLSGRDKAKSIHDGGVGTTATTSDFSVVPKDVAALDKRISDFFTFLGAECALTPEEQAARAADCTYGEYPLWRNVPKGDVVEFLKDVSLHSPDATRRMLRSLVNEIENAGNTYWKVVIANKTDKSGKSPCKINGVAYTLPPKLKATHVVNGVAHYASPHLYLPFYADIPKSAINEVDFHYFNELLGTYIIPVSVKSEANGDKDNLPSSLESALAPYPSDKEDFESNLQERFGHFLAENNKPPFDVPLPPSMRELFKGKLGGYNTRASSAYIERVFETAKAYTPILQFYFIESPVKGLPPLAAISFYWPKHEPDNFFAVSAGLQGKPQSPTRTRFCEAVEEVLAVYDFPMPTITLRSTIMEKLGPGCTENFFNDNISQIPKGRKYAPVPNRNAYMPLGWGGSKGVEARLDAELLSAAVAWLQKDGEAHKAATVFEEVLNAHSKLAVLFRAKDAKDSARFKKLFAPAVLAENGIAKTCGSPVKYQYRG